jgi:hypothetical protein
MKEFTMQGHFTVRWTEMDSTDPCEGCGRGPATVLCEKRTETIIDQTEERTIQETDQRLCVRCANIECDRLQDLKLRMEGPKRAD